MKKLMANALLLGAVACSVGTNAAPVELQCVANKDRVGSFRGLVLDPETKTVLYSQRQGDYRECRDVKVSDAAIDCKLGTYISNGKLASRSVSLDRYSGVLTEKAKQVFTVEDHFNCVVIDRTARKF